MGQTVEPQSDEEAIAWQEGWEQGFRCGLGQCDRPCRYCKAREA